jgi:hypothetical protein
MWTSQSEELPHAIGERFTIELDGRPATFADVIHAWQHDRAFRTFFNTLLADAPFTAYRWETPALTAATASHSFEFVLLNELGLVVHPDTEAFAEYFPLAVDGVAVFPNFGHDATLVVPIPQAGPDAYGHIATFVRLAPEPQQHRLWQAVGTAMANRFGTKPVWLSTAGAGVSWLHVRLDDRPKYYHYAPYRQTG